MNVKILIIDGHPVYIRKTEGFLKGLAYSDITLAATGADGLQKAAAIRPDLVIMSALLPDMDAHEVCQYIRIESGLSRIIVQFGLFTEEKDILRFKAEGADAVLARKEKDLKPLEDAIAALVRPQDSFSEI